MLDDKKVNENLIVLSILDSGMNTYSDLKKKLFFLSKEKLSKILFKFQNELIITIYDKGVYLTKDMYLVIKFINMLDDELSNIDSTSKSIFLAQRLTQKYNKDFTLEIRSLIKYV